MVERAPDVTRIPSQRVPILDLRVQDSDGNYILVSHDWFRFFQRLFILTGAGSDAGTVVDLQQGPELGGVLDGLFELAKDVQGAQVGPVQSPEPSPVRYGSFYSAVTQTAAVANTAYSVDFEAEALSYGVYQPVDDTQLAVDRPGLYSIDWTLQLDKTGAGIANLYTWLAVNGSDVASSATQHAVQATTGEASVNRNTVLRLAAGDYVEVKWSASSTEIQLTATATAAPVPAIPSASVNIYRTGD